MKLFSSLQKFIVTGKDRLKLLNRLLDKGIMCQEIVEKNESICFEALNRDKKAVFALASDLDCKLTSDNIASLSGVLKKSLIHCGFVIGLLMSIALAFLLNGTILQIKIETDNEDARRHILSVLDENGVHILSFYKDFDMIKLERELKTKVDEISWAGISIHGSTMVIDTLDYIPPPESDNKRMPCNVVAEYDCVIEKCEVYEGTLSVWIGSGVRAGDVIISGKGEKTITKKEKDKVSEIHIPTYTRASGKVYGQFSKTAGFFFPYEEYVNTYTGKQKNVSFLDVFDVSIPLFYGRVSGDYTVTSKTRPLVVLGKELPISIKDVCYSEYVSALNTYTDKQIDEKIDVTLKNYEESFLKGFEMRDKKTNINRTDKGVYVNAEYTLYGEIGAQSDIYVKKS